MLLDWRAKPCTFPIKGIIVLTNKVGIIAIISRTWKHLLLPKAQSDGSILGNTYWIVHEIKNKIFCVLIRDDFEDKSCKNMQGENSTLGNAKIGLMLTKTEARTGAFLVWVTGNSRATDATMNVQEFNVFMWLSIPIKDELARKPAALIQKYWRSFVFLFSSTQSLKKTKWYR